MPAQGLHDGPGGRAEKPAPSHGPQISTYSHGNVLLKLPDTRLDKRGLLQSSAGGRPRGPFDAVSLWRTRKAPATLKCSITVPFQGFRKEQQISLKTMMTKMSERC